MFYERDLRSTRVEEPVYRLLAQELQVEVQVEVQVEIPGLRERRLQVEVQVERHPGRLMPAECWWLAGVLAPSPGRLWAFFSMIICL